MLADRWEINGALRCYQEHVEGGNQLTEGKARSQNQQNTLIQNETNNCQQQKVFQIQQMFLDFLNYINLIVHYITMYLHLSLYILCF